jgi:hypothetical protein
MFIELLTTNAEFEELVIKAMLKHINPKVKSAIRDINKNIQEAIYNGIVKTQIYEELINGKLGYEFGFRKGSAKKNIDRVIKDLSTQFITNFKDFRFNGRDIDGGFEIFAIEADFKKILSNPSSSIKIKGGSLPWLEWLLIDGDKIIVSNHKVVFMDTRASRSGHAIMVKGGIRPFWRVPPEFSGVVDNNWITRASDIISDEINASLDDILSKVL